MKHAILTLVILLYSSYIVGQVERLANVPRIGDKFMVQTLTEVAPGACGADCVWNFSHANTDGAVKEIVYMLCPEYPDRLTKIFDATRYYECMTGDSLVCLGRESNTLKIEYDSPETIAVFPVNYGDSLSGYFYGRGNYCDMVVLRVRGTYAVKADGLGTVILPDGNAIKNVMRIHTKRAVSCESFPSDSVWPPYKNYSSYDIQQILAEDSLVVYEDVYRWYATGYRYPILVFSTMTVCGEETITSAYYCPTFEQSCLVDEVNEAKRANVDKKTIDDDEKCAIGSALPYLFHNDRMEHSVSVSVNNSSLLELEVVLASVGGVVYKSEKRQASSDMAISFDYGNLPLGQYAVYIRIGDERYTEKFSY